MMNNFIEIELNPSKFGGGSFDCKASFKLDNFASSFQNVDVKIDTGCAISTIPVRKLKVAESICKELKSSDIDRNLDSIRSYGVETGGLKHNEPITKRQKMRCKALKFKHSVSDLRLGGVKIPSDHIFLNYDRSGNILIGMDILKLMVCHIDISKKTGMLTMLCCPRESLNGDFMLAMKEHFGVTEI